ALELGRIFGADLGEARPFVAEALRGRDLVGREPRQHEAGDSANDRIRAAAAGAAEVAFDDLARSLGTRGHDLECAATRRTAEPVQEARLHGVTRRDTAGPTAGRRARCRASCDDREGRAGARRSIASPSRDGTGPASARRRERAPRRGAERAPRGTSGRTARRTPSSSASGSRPAVGRAARASGRTWWGGGGGS